MEKISDISIDDTVTSEIINENTFIKNYDWAYIYGELGERRI